MSRVIPLLALFAAALGLSGCGNKAVGISGTVTRDGQKLTWPDGGNFLVVFSPEHVTPATPVYSAKTDMAASTYRIDAIPPGRYKVGVQQFDTHFMDALRGVYDPGSTPLLVEVTHDGQVIDIDLPKELPPRKAFGSSEGGDGKKGGFKGGKKGGRKKDDEKKDGEQPEEKKDDGEKKD